MTIIHLSSDSARSGIVAFKSAQSVLAAYLQELATSNRNLDIAWQGGDKATFSGEMQVFVRDLTTRQEDLAQLVHRFELEIAEWEETDQRGASSWKNDQWSVTWLAQQLPLSGGSSNWVGNAGSIILPLFTLISTGSLLPEMPDWLQKILDRFFPSGPIISPIPDQPVSRSAPGAVANPPDDETIPQTSPTEPVASSASSSAGTVSPPVVIAPEPVLDIHYDVPVKSQGDYYGNAACSLTSVSMVTGYFHDQDSAHKSVSQEQLKSLMDQGDGTPGKGVALSNLNDELNDLGYHNITTKVNANLDDLKNQLQRGPVIVTTGVKIVGPGSAAGGATRAIIGPGNATHAMVVTGINAETVVVNDPWTGSQMQLPIDTFNKMWNNGSNGIYAIRP